MLEFCMLTHFLNAFQVRRPKKKEKKANMNF